VARSGAREALETGTRLSSRRDDSPANMSFRFPGAEGADGFEAPDRHGPFVFFLMFALYETASVLLIVHIRREGRLTSKHEFPLSWRGRRRGLRCAGEARAFCLLPDVCFIYETASVLLIV